MSEDSSTMGSQEHPITFESFIASMGANAMMAMGVAQLPDHHVERNMTLAREFIDILGMLQDKTRGNLTPKEEHMLQDLISELRLSYVEQLEQGGE